MKTKNLFSKIACGALAAAMVACGQTHDTEQASKVSQPEPFTQEGVASYYARSLTGAKMANGKQYHPAKMIAAHKRLPLGTKVKVTNPDNDSSVVVTIADRGPYVGKRIIDVSRSAARELNFIKDGKTTVKVEVIEPAAGYSISDSVAADRIVTNY